MQGVGYEVDVPMSTFYNLPATGERVTLFTHLVVREDAHLLYGFGTENERRAFRQLLKISGVGARTALSVLSGLSVAELAQAVTLQDIGPAHQDPRHRQEDRRAPAARAEGQARRRPHDRGRRASRAARVERHPARAARARLQRQGSGRRGEDSCPTALAVADGIRQALKLLAEGR